jgi:hypothetical protein
MTVTTTMTTGGAAAMPDGVGDEFEAPLKRAEVEFGPWRPPRRDRDRLGVGGVGTPTTGLDDHRDPDGEKIEAGVVSGANCAAYAAEGPTKGGGGLTRVVLSTGPTTTTARARGLAPGRCSRHMLPSSDESHDRESAFFWAAGGGRGR